MTYELKILLNEITLDLTYINAKKNWSLPEKMLKRKYKESISQMLKQMSADIFFTFPHIEFSQFDTVKYSSVAQLCMKNPMA